MIDPQLDPRPAIGDAYDAIEAAIETAVRSPLFSPDLMTDLEAAELAIVAARVEVDRRADLLARSDLIGLERSESPSFAPRTLHDVSRAPRAECVHRGNTPAKSTNLTRDAASESALRAEGRELGCGTLGLASDGIAVALDPFGSRTRLRDASHGDDGSPGDGRVGA